MVKNSIQAGHKRELYKSLAQQLKQLLANEDDFIANAAVFAALIYQRLPSVNWSGFYLLKGETLILGPFQGQLACMRIPLGKGACGLCAQSKETVIINDVANFPGYIACDIASKAEIVIPIVTENQLIGVFDLDSPKSANFDNEDATGLQKLIEIFLKLTNIPRTRAC